MDIGLRIQAYRVRSGLSQEALAERLDISRQSVSKWELSQSLPEIDKVVQLCNIFGISTDTLLLGEIPTRTKPSTQTLHLSTEKEIAAVKAKVKKERNREFFYYCTNNNLEKAKEIWTQGGINLEYEYAMNTVLMQATRNGHTNIVEWLLEIGATLNSSRRDKKTALDFAEEYNHKEIVTLLRKAKNEGES